ncbi:hypothetical protein H477_5539 [[Clostridium] sordellii ATCC 9714]|nr:hypothetical protein H477_5539 [[Clostridium] sordellii ATCC 9714] [Paeniclostridium sordellii ATCC 9714]
MVLNSSDVTLKIYRNIFEENLLNIEMRLFNNKSKFFCI